MYGNLLEESIFHFTITNHTLPVLRTFELVYFQYDFNIKRLIYADVTSP